MKKIVMMLVALIGMMQIAEAHPRKSAHKQYNQHKRIEHGVHSGQLTPKQAHMLRIQQAKLHNYKVMARADGKITHRERQLINRTQKNANRNIYHQKHDGPRRNWR
jgi:hypothetical protein